MKILKPNPLGQKEAIKRIKEKFDSLLDQSFTDVKITNPIFNWDNDVLTFSFKARRSLVSVTISGKITVLESAISVICDIPNIVKMFVAEEVIQSKIEKELVTLLQ